MAKRRREKMSEGKKNIIASLIQEYDIKTAEDIQEALKDLLGGTIQEMMEAELDEHLGYEEYERSDNTDYRNGVKHKTLRSSYGEIPIDVPQDRDGDFERGRGVHGRRAAQAPVRAPVPVYRLPEYFQSRQKDDAPQTRQGCRGRAGKVTKQKTARRTICGRSCTLMQAVIY